MCGLLGLDRSSPRRLSALGLGLRAGQRTRAQHGPTVLRRLPRGDGASRSVSRGGAFLVAAEGCPGCPCSWCRRAAALPGPGRIRGGFAQLVMALRHAPRRAQDCGASRCWPVWAGAYVEASTEWEACESRRGSGVPTQFARENGADPGGPGARCREGQGAPTTRDRL